MTPEEIEHKKLYHREWNKRHYHANAEWRAKSLLASKKYQQDHKDDPQFKRKAAARMAAYRKCHPEKVIAQRQSPETKAWYRIYLRHKRATDPLFKITRSLRDRFKNALRSKRLAKTESPIELIGCSIPELRRYLENQWMPGMSWENYGLKGWHIDHSRPIKSFDLTQEEERRTCFHYTNLQPLWAADNLKKRFIEVML